MTEQLKSHPGELSSGDGGCEDGGADQWITRKTIMT